MSRGKRCPQFGDFVDMAELHDLGFRGLPFTWHRGWLFETGSCVRKGPLGSKVS